MSSTNLTPVLFVPHGGGPMPLLDEPNHRELTAFLRGVAQQLPPLRAIVVITAHWEERVVTISSHPAPGLMYDYQGFPAEAYQLHYPAPGNPGLAQSISRLLAAQGIDSRLDAQRDYDHGTFVPLMLMYPGATIPVVQISLVKSLDPAEHIALGRALAPLREQGVLLLGSGMSFHNMRAFFTPNPATQERSDTFDQWLTETLVAPGLLTGERSQRMEQWQSAPEARFCHPREEHLLPLHVCYGAGSVATPTAEKIFSGFLFDTKISAFLWR